jgi:hypothetical protein
VSAPPAQLLVCVGGPGPGVWGLCAVGLNAARCGGPYLSNMHTAVVTQGSFCRMVQLLGVRGVGGLYA